MPARLTVYLSDRPVRQHVLDESEQYVIGRDAAAAIRIVDETLSRKHARLTFTDSGWRLTDLCSKNGTLVDGRRINQCDLGKTQWIEFGSVLACFDVVSAEALAADERVAGERWQTSVHLSRQLAPGLDADELLGKILDGFVAAAAAERGFLMLGADPAALRVGACSTADIAEFSGSRSVIERALSEVRPIVCSDTNRDALLGGQPSIVSGTLRALACIPLMVGDSLIGAIYVDSREAGKQFTELDMEILQALADHAALVLGVAQLRDDIVDLSDMLPTELNRGAPPDAALIEKVQHLLPQLKGRDFGRGQDIAVAGADT